MTVVIKRPLDKARIQELLETLPAYIVVVQFSLPLVKIKKR